MRDDAGKVQYATNLEFDDREVADRFTAAAITVIQDFELSIGSGPS